MRFIFPPHPHPESKILPASLPDYQKSGQWLAQLKFNGAHVVCWSDGADAGIRDRRGNELATYRLTPAMHSLLCNLGKKKEVVIAGELLHTKAKLATTQQQAASNTIVLFDVLYYGRNLLDKDQVTRLGLLHGIAGSPTRLEPKERAFEVASLDEANLWLAEVFKDDFEYQFYKFFDMTPEGHDKFPDIEGLMLRQTTSMLDRAGDRAYDCRWLVRCRKQKPKVYQY